MKRSILLSSAGRRVALLRLFRTALAERGGGRVLAADSSQLSAACRLADGSFTVPRINEDRFLPSLLELCAEEHVVLVVPTIDPELPIYAAHREDFGNLGTLVAVSSPETVRIGADKRLTHEFLVSRGFPTVRQADAQEPLRDPADWTFPLVLKPPAGSAANGVRMVASPRELAAAVEVASGDLITESKAPGREYTVDVLVDGGGRCVEAVPRLRLEVRAGEVSKAVTARVPLVMDLAREVAEALPGAFGVLNIQMFWDRASGQANIIEINPRFGGGYPLAAAAGANYVEWLTALALEGRPSTAATAWKDGLTMLRYDDAVFMDGLYLDTDDPDLHNV